MFLISGSIHRVLLIKKIIMNSILALLLAFTFSVSNIYAEELNIKSPEAIAKQTVKNVLISLHEDKEVVHDFRKMDHLVSTLIIPRFDFIYMTKLTIGDQKWATASPREQSDLVDEYRTILSHLFSSILSEYDNESVSFTSVMMPADQSAVVIKSEVISPTEEPTEMDFKFKNTENGWKVYSVELGGIDLIRTYKLNFKNALKSGGVPNLIRVLHKKNQEFIVIKNINENSYY